MAGEQRERTAAERVLTIIEEAVESRRGEEARDVFPLLLFPALKRRSLVQFPAGVGSFLFRYLEQHRLLEAGAAEFTAGIRKHFSAPERPRPPLLDQLGEAIAGSLEGRWTPEIADDFLEQAEARLPTFLASMGSGLAAGNTSWLGIRGAEAPSKKRRR